jgi:RNA polymerase-interacting CarD/CdnL/TRCF family regulator
MCMCMYYSICVYHARMRLRFKVPLLGSALFGLRRATGYDRQGNVRAVMTAEESEHRYKHEQRTVSKRGRA